MIFKKVILSVIFIAWLCPLFAQQLNSEITGTVIDKNSKAIIEFATVELLNRTDSSVIGGTVTDNAGKFNFKKVPRGIFWIRYSFIGYTRAVIQVTIDKAKVNLGALPIIPLSGELTNVTVSSTRSLLNTSIDRKSYDVTKDIMAQSGTASDILRNIPSVEVDMEGNLSLRGSGDVIILINGRPSPLFSKLNKAEVLQQFPANTIERIEVITNPSARYKPDGTSGIINIVLKKNVKGGWNSSVIMNAGNRNRFNGAVTINYNPGKLNIYGNVGIRKDSRNRWNTVDRQYFDSLTHTLSGFYTENGMSAARPLTYLARLGFTYSPDKANSFGISGNYSNRQQVRNDVNTKIFSDQTSAYTSYFDRLRYDPENEREKDLTGFFEHKFPGEDHDLRIELTVSSSKDKEDNHYENKYRYPANSSTFDNTKIFQGDNQQELTIDYARAISETANLEAGYSGSFNQMDFDFHGEYFDFSSGRFITDIVKTNQFLFDQSVHALYATYKNSYKKFGYSVGLRLEEAIIKGRQVTKDTAIHNDYLKLYPTLHLAYELTDESQLQLNYSRRIHRPEGDDINPFPEYQDPYNVRAGNAKLLPEIIHSVEFGYKWQHKGLSFVPSLYYRYKENGFTQVTVPLSDSVLLTTQQNLSSDQSLGLELIFSAKTGKLSTNLSTNLFYNQVSATHLGYFGKRNIFAFSTNLNSTCTITPTTMAQFTAIFYSARVTPQGKRYATFVLNAGIRQDLFKKKMSVTFSASDILKTLNQKNRLSSSYLDQLAIGRRDGQVVFLGLSYRLGKTIKKPDDKIQFEE